MYETDDIPAVSATAVSHRYGRRDALRDISFRLPAGGVVGLVGANGSGKSTLLRIIAGVTRPSSGSLSISGTDLASNESSGAGVGAAIDGMSLWPGWTVERNLRYLCGLAGIAPTKIGEVARMTGLTRELRTKLRRLSLGNRQRVSIAAAALCGTRLVLLDEPMNGLDPDARRQTRDLITTLALEGRTVVFSSHDLHDVETVCRDLIVLESGCLVFSGALEDYAEQMMVVALGIVEQDAGRAAAALTGAQLRWWADRSGRPVVALDDADEAERVLTSADVLLQRSEWRPATLEERFDERR